MTLDAEDTEHIEAEFANRLKVGVEQAVGNNSELEGSNTWLLLNALISCDNNDHQSLITHFEQSGCLLAEQGALDVGVNCLHESVGILSTELKNILYDQPVELSRAMERLYQLCSQCTLALTRGYQRVLDQDLEEKIRTTQQLEHRLQALQHINGVSNSTMDLDQTLEITAQVVAEELHAGPLLNLFL